MGAPPMSPEDLRRETRALIEGLRTRHSKRHEEAMLDRLEYERRQRQRSRDIARAIYD